MINYIITSYKFKCLISDSATASEVPMHTVTLPYYLWVITKVELTSSAGQISEL